MLKEPIRLTLITLSKSASAIGPSLPITRLATPMPAQFTSTRAGPWAAGGLGDRGFRRGRVGNVADHGDAADLGGDGFGELGVEIADRDLGALRREPARGRGAQSRCAAGDDGGLVLQLHGLLPDKLFFEFSYSVITCAGGAGE